ncbi:hypothetical protein NX794_21415, partial [Streptomyces sp. LP11]|nr:hypothetical protein [Streptomyces sp. LP11]
MGRLRLRSTRVGDALLIHPKGRFDERAAAFAEGITGDPGHTLVVVDLPAGALATEWEAVAKLLSSSRYGSPRLVFGRGTGDDVRTAGRLIATRLGREVLAPDGDLIPTRSGQLFVPGDDGAAWLRFRPGRDAEPVGQRFPKPHWEFSAPARTRPAGTHSVAQPVPAGVWLRRTDGDPPAGRYRRAMETLPIDADLYLVALGSPGTPPLALADVARFWDTVLPGARSAVRFLLYGALDTPADRAPGQALADALGHRTVLYGGPVPGETGAAAEAAEAVYVPSEVALPVPDSASVPVPVPLPLPRIRTESGGGSAAGTTAAAGAGTAKGSDTEPTSVPEPSPEAVQAAVSAAAPLPFPPNSPAPSPEPAPEITEPQQPDPVPP